MTWGDIFNSHRRIGVDASYAAFRADEWEQRQNRKRIPVERKFWLSWYHTDDIGEFELHTPWWLSGHRSSDEAATICAAITAEDEDGAKEKVMSSYDDRPDSLEWRFCKEQEKGWSPFSGRFPRGKWMKWNDT